MRLKPFWRATLGCAVVSGAAWAHGPRDLPSEDKPTTPVNPEAGEQEYVSFHFQFTAATQAHPSFPAAYSGANSMNPNAESATAFVSTVYADARLWPGAELLFNPEMSGGAGLSQTLGVAAFPSGIVYRVLPTLRMSTTSTGITGTRVRRRGAHGRRAGDDRLAP